VADHDVTERVTSALDERRSFLVDSGAGAGKTHTLVQALRHLLTCAVWTWPTAAAESRALPTPT
jgi:ATP-dependent exoDNAse (exonuclease V) beta subunit